MLMPDLLNPTTLDMGATRTFLRREVTWYPWDANGEAGLVIRLWTDRIARRGRRKGCHWLESALYLVTREDPPVGQPGQMFSVHKVSDTPGQAPDAEDAGPYKVFLGAMGLPCRCSCKAGRCWAESDRHVDALLTLHEARQL